MLMGQKERVQSKIRLAYTTYWPVVGATRATQRDCVELIADTRRTRYP